MFNKTLTIFYKTRSLTCINERIFQKRKRNMSCISFFNYDKKLIQFEQSNISLSKNDQNEIRISNSSFSFSENHNNESRNNDNNNNNINNFENNILDNNERPVSHNLFNNLNIENLNHNNHVLNENDNINDILIKFFNSTLKNNIAIQSVFLSLVLIYLWKFNPIIFFIIFWIFTVYKIFFNLKKIIKFNADINIESKNLIRVSTLQFFILFVFENLTYISFKFQIFSYLYSIYVFSLIVIIDILFLSYLKINDNSIMFTHFIEAIIKMMIFIQLIFIYFKIEKNINWIWRTVFWIYWIFFTFAIILTGGFFIVFCGKLYEKIISKITNIELLGVFWLVLINIGISINSFLIMSCIIDCYDYECNKDNLSISFAFILNYSIVYIVFSSYYKKKIIKFLGKITWDESFTSSIESSINNYQDNSNLNQNKKNIFNVKKNNFKDIIYPIFLMKYSSNYFKIYNQQIIKKNNSIYPIDNKVKSIAKTDIKPKIFHRKNISNSFYLPSTNDNFFDKFDNLINENNLISKEASDDRFLKENHDYLFKSLNKFTKVNKSDNVIHNNENYSSVSLTERKSKNINVNEISKNSSGLFCVICVQEPPNAVFMECGHGGICFKCAIKIFNAKNECFLCRQKITQILNLDLNSKNKNIYKVLDVFNSVNEE